MPAALINPVPSARMSSPFGPRVNPVTGLYQSLHNGLDLAAPTGTPVHAAAAGTVISVVHGDAVSGNWVGIDHGDGDVTQYLHLSAIHVAKGPRIGDVGSTGRSTGPHLHFIVKRAGAAIDPKPLISGAAGAAPAIGGGLLVVGALIVGGGLIYLVSKRRR
jgi:murein DD-endopeptidase MepM/ murein hydrolase activator NlpD